VLDANVCGHTIFVLSNSNEKPGLPILKNQFETVFRPKKTLKFKFSEKPLTNLGGFFVAGATGILPLAGQWARGLEYVLLTCFFYFGASLLLISNFLILILLNSIDKAKRMMSHPIKDAILAMLRLL
jgi:hypothetical protein